MYVTCEKQAAVDCANAENPFRLPNKTALYLTQHDGTDFTPFQYHFNSCPVYHNVRQLFKGIVCSSKNYAAIQM